MVIRFVFKKLRTCSHVLFRVDSIKKSLQEYLGTQVIKTKTQFYKKKNIYFVY